jgi:glycosyltransferase involved in cell wall biosynthesis
MKIHILATLKEGPWGGGNQFLKALRLGLVDLHLYEENAELADVIVFNSFPFGEEHRFRELYQLKKKHKLIIHRLDGPISEVRGKDIEIDQIIYTANQAFADGTVFQSNWSREENYRLGLKQKRFEKVILNAPDPAVFNRLEKIPFSSNRKVKLIAVSWSKNLRKGFSVYQFLDEHLDFTKYEMTFIGNSPIQLKNIKQISALDSKQLAEQFKQHDIYLTASEKDPCSNALIEALHCGLPALVLNDGGHPEIVGKGGETFNKPEEISGKLLEIVMDYTKYVQAIDVPNLKEITHQYVEFIDAVYTSTQRGSYVPPTASLRQLGSIYAATQWWKIKNKFKK